MTRRKHRRLVREGDLIAEVEVDLLEDEDPGRGWGPYLSVHDVEKLEHVREAMSRRDLPAAAKLAKLYRLTAVPEATPVRGDGAAGKR